MPEETMHSRSGSGSGLSTSPETSSSFMGFVNSGDFDKMYPNFLRDCEPLERFMQSVKSFRGPSEHHAPVCSLLLSCWELYAGIVKTLQAGLPGASVALARNLMENAMGCQYLADNPETWRDFVAHAEYILLKIRKPPSGDPGAARLKELKQLFGNQGWYRMSIESLARKTGYESAYESFYREACAFTHASALPLLIPRKGIGTDDIGATVEQCSDGARDYGTMALTYGTLFIHSASAHTNTNLGLQLESQIAEFWARCIRRGWFTEASVA